MAQGAGRGRADLDCVAAAIESLRRKGFGRLLIDNRALAFDDVEPARLANRSTLQVIVDRLQLNDEDMRQRLTDSIETAYLEGGGAAWAIESTAGPQSTDASDDRRLTTDDSRLLRFSERFECRPCGIAYEDPQPRLFSFNNPFGACPTCHGFGNIIELDMDLVVPDPTKSIQQGAIEPWSKPHYRAQLAELKRAAKKRKLRLDVAWADLTDEEKRFVIEGGDDYDGIRGFFRWLERKKYKVHVRVFLSRYRGYLTCPDCGGARLRREARDVRVGGRTIDQVSSLTVQAAQEFFSGLQLSDKEAAIAEKVLKEIRRRLSFLSDVGLDYLTLDRLSSTLSGGEAQRINLATSLGSALVGTLYVLDEPSIGLHSRDNLRLIDILRQLRDQGNTVIVVEHDADMIKVADHIVDLGLGAGEQGGRVVFSGHARRADARAALADVEVPAAGARDSGADDAPARDGTEDPADRRERAQPEGRRRHDSAEHAHLRDRRQRVGQIDARPRRALCGHQAREGRLGQARRHVQDARRGRVHHRRGARRSDADRPDAAIEPGHLSEGVRSDPRAVRGDEGRPVARPDGQPFLVQRAGRPLRGVPGRRRGARRDAVSRRRVRALRSVRRQALQAAGARRPVSRPLDSPGARPHRARGADLLQQLAEGAAAAAGARRDRPRLPAPRPAGDDAVGRRGAAHQDRGAPVVAQRRAPALHPRRADHRPALRRHREAADRVPQAARGRPHAAGHRTQPRRDQDGRLHHRSRTRGRRGGRVGRRHRHAGTGGPDRDVIHGALPPSGAGRRPVARVRSRRARISRAGRTRLGNYYRAGRWAYEKEISPRSRHVGVVRACPARPARRRRPGALRAGEPGVVEPGSQRPASRRAAAEGRGLSGSGRSARASSSPMWTTTSRSRRSRRS